MVKYPETLHLTDFQSYCQGHVETSSKLQFLQWHTSLYFWNVFNSFFFLLYLLRPVKTLLNVIFLCFSHTLCWTIASEGPKVDSDFNFLAFYSVQLWQTLWVNDKSPQRMCQGLLFSRSPCNPCSQYNPQNHMCPMLSQQFALCPCCFTPGLCKWHKAVRNK